MFGYLTIYKPELKVKDFYKYKAYYCGLCRTLKEKYGISGQVTLTYDMTCLIILLTSLYEENTKESVHRCPVHPMKKQGMLQNEITEYAADMNLILAYYHLADDWKDEKKLPALAGMKVLKKKVKKAVKKYPRQSEAIRGRLKEITAYEKENITDIDQMAGCFGRLMAELLAYREDQWANGLRRLGFYLGKFIYIMDAYDDLKEDMEKGRYNPLIPLAGRDTYEEDCRQMLLMMMAECSREFEKLPCLLDADILKNIFYAGVWGKYNQLQKSREEKGTNNNHDK